ncbi:MAG: hypothetical protein AB8I56_19505 [Anaerolineales bacterium]|jgi:hypothetical protein
MTYTDSSNPINISGLIIAVLFSTVIPGILIGIVSFLSLGLTVKSISTVFLAGLSIAVKGDFPALVRVYQKQVILGDFQ